MLGSGEEQAKLKQFLKKHTTYSVIDRGVELATTGNVLECSKTGTRIQAIVDDGDSEQYSVVLEIVSAKEVNARCGCCSHEEMQEQWCSHGVAVLWQAHDLEFFEPESGFAAQESVYRMNTTSPTEIAQALEESSNLCAEKKSHHTAHTPDVSILLDLTSDRLGVQVLFDGVAQTIAIFGDSEENSNRALDNVLLQILDDEGNWDDDSNTWFINSSKGIEIVLGLIREYPAILSATTEENIAFSDEPLEARVSIEWRDTSAELILHWILPDGSEQIKEREVLGTGPFWTVIDNTIYRLSPAAARTVGIFPYSSTITLNRSQVGPILELFNDGQVQNEQVIRVVNPEDQPDSEVKTPTPILELESLDASAQHFAGQDQFQILGQFHFDYPTPPENENVVYLPDREEEQRHIDKLRELGFEYASTKRRYIAAGDTALDIVHSGKGIFPSEWKVNGLEVVKKSVKFAELALDVSVSTSTAPPADRMGTTGIDWFDCQISLTQNNANVPLSSIFKNAQTKGERWIRLDSGAFAQVPGGGMDKLRTLLGSMAPNYRLSNTIKTKLSSAQAVALARADSADIAVTADRNLKAIARKLEDFDNIKMISGSKGLKGSLRPYQTEGLSWLHFLNEFKLDGILADEMGLGKTVQTLSLLQFLKDSRTGKKAVKKPSLVVAPTSVITNWFYEAQRFTPGLKTLLLHGPKRKELFAEVKDYDIVITSYALLRMDRLDLEQFEFQYIILDEAQNIKNPQAATTKAAKALRSERRLALSGTPTENRPMELWSIFDFLMPGYLGSHEFFRTHIEKPILEEGTAVPVAQFLNRKTKPFVLRRMKAEVEKDLPEKVESVVYVPMAPSQQELYNQILEEVRPQVFEAVNERGIRGASISILAALLRLRQVCNHPNSIEALEDVKGYESGKFDLMKELITEALDSNRKILLFSQFKGMLSIIREWLDKESVNHLYLDGGTKNRQDLVDQFNSDDKVRLFLISLKAGGTGLNLTAADTVMIYDPWWNPAVEVQAVDRAHRIGQTKKVSVYRMVTENSIEQKIMALKERKSQIVDCLVNENGLSTLDLSKADLENFFDPLPSR